MKRQTQNMDYRNCSRTASECGSMHEDFRAATELPPFPNSPPHSEPFWMVYGLGKNAPSVTHKTFERATTEASRLARENPGVNFYVLATVGCAVKVDVEFRRIDSDAIPF